MSFVNISKKIGTYLLAGTMSIMPMAETAAKKKVSHSGHALKSLTHGVKPGAKLKGVKSDTYESFSAGKRVVLENGTRFTTSQLAKRANETGRKIKAPKTRPLPITNSSGRIVANVKVHMPTAKGSLSGKTIIINAGHGGYNPKNGYFDPGTFAFDSKGKRIEEWYKAQNFTDEIIPALTAKGAKVIYMNGAAKSVVTAKGKYSKSSAFISIHCNSATPNKKINGQSVIYNDANDKNLAVIVEKILKKSNINSKPTKDVRGLGVLKAVRKMPSILVEVGYESNPKDLKNIDSKDYRKKFARNLASGLESYFKKRK